MAEAAEAFGGFGTPEEVAPIAAMLLSPRSSYVAGDPDVPGVT